MAKRILLIQGHPDASASHLCHALASSYIAGAEESGHAVRQIKVAELDFPLLRSQKDFEGGGPFRPASSQHRAPSFGPSIWCFFPL